MEQLALSWEPERRLYTVKSLTAELRGLLAERFGDVWVAGEITGAKLAASGHYYFSLKDDEAQLRCACFRPSLLPAPCEQEQKLSLLPFPRTI